MSNLILLGTDTDVGKTTVALLWLHVFGSEWNYWKPVESGDSDSAKVKALVPGAIVHPPLQRFAAPVAPLLAARREGKRVPSSQQIIDARPSADRLLIETFGSAFSPLDDNDLQLTLIRALGEPCVLVSSPRLGGIGRTLQALTALRAAGIEPAAVVMLGERDPFCEEQIHTHEPTCAVIALEPPEQWTLEGIASCANRQRAALERLRATLDDGTGSSSLLPFPCWDADQRRGTRKASRGSDSHTNAAALLANDRRAVWHPYTSLSDADEPLVCAGAEREFLELADGRRVIDGISSWWTILHGHRHSPLIDALTEAARRLDHVLFAGVTHPAAIELADLLLGTMPWVGGRVFYSDNGSTAVEVALKLAYQSWRLRGEPQRTRFVGFEHGYHGDTFGAMAVSRDPVFFGHFEPLLFQADILPLDPDRLDEHLRHHANQTSAVILEPLVQGAGGMRMHAPETLRHIVEITHRHGVLFIADEVMTGGGRTGTLWAHQAAGVVPDLICAAKTLTGGMLPLAATLVAPALVALFLNAKRSDTFFHGHSFTANPLACAVAARNYRALLENPPSGPRRMETFWNTALAPLKEERCVTEVRVRGSIAAIELQAAGGYLADAATRMRRTCLEHDVFLRPLGNVLYAMPPYCTSDESLARLAEAMIAAMRGM